MEDAVGCATIQGMREIIGEINPNIPSVEDETAERETTLGILGPGVSRTAERWRTRIHVTAACSIISIVSPPPALWRKRMLHPGYGVPSKVCSYFIPILSR